MLYNYCLHVILTCSLHSIRRNLSNSDCVKDAMKDSELDWVQLCAHTHNCAILSGDYLA